MTIETNKIKLDIALICRACKHSCMWGAQSPPEKRSRFFLEFIRRLLEHTSLLNLAYRMNKVPLEGRGQQWRVGWGEAGKETVGHFPMMHMSPQFCKHTCAQRKILLTQQLTRQTTWWPWCEKQAFNSDFTPSTKNQVCQFCSDSFFSQCIEVLHCKLKHVKGNETFPTLMKETRLLWSAEYLQNK